MELLCKICAGHWPPADHLIADCGITVAYLFEDQFFAGWTVLVLKRHATELFHLSTDERRRLIEEVSALAGALMEVFHPAKINYELLGNQLPHIHWHVIPRLVDDAARRVPVWTVEHQSKALTSTERAERIDMIRTKLGSTN